MSFKTTVKHGLQSALAGSKPAYVVASLGRSGSTVVYDAVLECVIATRFPQMAGLGLKIARDDSWNLGEKKLYGGCVYKTHDYPEAIVGNDKVRCVFMFGSTIDAALSVHSALERYSPEWVEEHFGHLKSDGDVSQLFETYVLGFYEQVRRWSTVSSLPVLCLRYETLWEHEKELADFCKLPVTLPEKRARVEKSYPDDVMQKAREVYGPIDDRLAALPDCFLAGPNMSSYFARVDVNVQGA
jgi:hypothetical protein